MRFLRRVIGFAYLACVPAGVLWALSPLGVRLSEYGLKSPDPFWKLFPSVLALVIVGFIGVYLCVERATLLERVGLLVALAGAGTAIVGCTGLYEMRLDDVFIMSAPFYRAFRIGLFVLPIGALVFAFGAARSRSLPLWGMLPVVVTSLSGAISTVYDLGVFGATLWISFGAGLAWLGIALFFRNVAGYLKRRGGSAKSPERRRA